MTGALTGITMVVFTLAVSGWTILHILKPRRLRDADGRARMTGNCGDTMEISLAFHDGCVSKIAHRTDGCAYSLTCLVAATRLAEGKRPEDLLDITPWMIERSAGALPDDHKHCAALAAKTLHAAVDDYMAGSR